MVSITNDIGGNAYGQYYSYSEIKDANGNVIEGSLNNAIDGLPTRYRALGVNTDYAYDSLNRLTRRNVDLTNDIQTLYTYKDSLRGSGYTTTQLATEKLGEISYGYNYDNMGNITSITKGSNAYKSYMYDSLGQLIQEQNISNSTMTSYSYNHLGNITAKHINDYNGINEKAIVQYGYSADSDAGWKYLLTSITTTDYTNDSTTTETIDYDAIGNPISYRGAAMAWKGRQLTGYAKNGVTSTFKYDADGLRSSKTVGGVKTEYQYVGDQLFYEKRGDSQEFYYFYDSYGNLSTIYYTLNNNGTTSRAVYHALTNAQGDVVALYNSAGNLVAQYEYDAWGNTLSVKDALGVAITAWYNIAVANPIRYRGYYYDKDLGLYYLQSRYYDSTIGRFINADGYVSTGQGVTGHNMFAYCNNNPVMYSDPSGQVAWWLVALGVLAITAIDHAYAKYYPGGYTFTPNYKPRTEVNGKNYKEKVAYIEGSGASIHQNGVTLFDAEAGLYSGTADLGNGTEFTPFNMLNASATAELDVSGGFSGEISGIASLASIGFSPVINFGDVAQIKIDITYHLGYAGIGAEWDFGNMDFAVNSPSVGCGWKLGVDFDWK